MSNFWRTPYQQDGSALVYAGEGAVLEMELQSDSGGGLTDEDLSARLFVQRVIDRDGSVLAQVAGSPQSADGARFTRFTLTHDVIAGLLTGGRTAVDLRHFVYEQLEDDGRDVFIPPVPFSVRALDDPSAPPPDGPAPEIDGPIARFTLQRRENSAPRLIVTYRGAVGPMSPTASLARIASGALSGERLVKDRGDGTVSYPDIIVASDGELILGLTKASAADGDPVDVQIWGEMSFSGWAWTPGPVFAAANGQLTQAPEGAAFLRQIGLAVTATKIVIALQPPIVTS